MIGIVTVAVRNTCCVDGGSSDYSSLLGVKALSKWPISIQPLDSDAVLPWAVSMGGLHVDWAAEDFWRSGRLEASKESHPLDWPSEWPCF